MLKTARTSGDPSLVERLVANLVANAVHHNIPGGRLDIVTGTLRGAGDLRNRERRPRDPGRRAPRVSFNRFSGLPPTGRFCRRGRPRSRDRPVDRRGTRRTRDRNRSSRRWPGGRRGLPSSRLKGTEPDASPPSPESWPPSGAVVALSLLAAGCGGGGGHRSRASPLLHDSRHPHDPDGERAGRLLPVHALQRLTELPRPAALRRWERQADHPPTRAESPACPGGPGLPAITCSRRTAAASSRKTLSSSAPSERTRCGSPGACVAHGVSRFPDPTAQGQLTVEMVQAEGIDVHTPAVLQAVQACLPASHGALAPRRSERR